MQDKKAIGTGILTAVMASLCCVAPLLALVTGVGTLASAFSWIEPLRPYLIGATVIVLAWAWYQKLKKQPEDACGCAPTDKQKFYDTKGFLALITVFAAVMLMFPYYSAYLYPQTATINTAAANAELKQAHFKIIGMTCTGCEAGISYQLNQLPGINQVEVSYEKGAADVRYEAAKLNEATLIKAIKAAGYEAVSND